ncbi:MAG: DUF2185 domain-containing protein [Planctomycetes bacterium]|nr:DUF2185 domain-containing protein [Planctomycetota bacterium]
MSSKPFRLSTDAIRDIVLQRGSCLATDRITVDGARVNWMYRETPDDDSDSGWRFFAGDESKEYAETPSNYEFYNVNTIANYCADVVPFLDLPYGSACGRDESGVLRVVERPEGDDLDVRTLPDAEGETELSDGLVATLPGRFRRRVEDGALVLWRPGITAWVCAYDTGEKRDRWDADTLRSGIPESAFDRVEERAGELVRFAYRVHEPAPDQRRPAFQGLVLAPGHFVDVAVYFDEERDVEHALALWRSLRVHAAT